MRLLIIATALGVCAAGRLDNTYLPPGSGGIRNSNSGFGNSGSHGSFGGGTGNQGSFGGGNGHHGSFGGSSGNQGSFGTGGGFQTQHAGNVYNAGPAQYRQQNSQDAGAQILRFNSDVTAEGFSYDFETSNGIRADATGAATNGVQSHGSFGYRGDDGQDYSITYTADENGYQPQGAHLPTPPPIPEAILKSLEQNARDEAAGISDDGAYHGEGAGSGGYGSSSNQYGGAGARNQGSSGYQGGSSGYQGNQNRQSNFGAASSRQYLAPSTGQARGSGNFNSQSGYQY